MLKVKINIGKVKPKWLTKEVRNQIFIKEKAWRRLRARKTPLKAERYRQERNKTNASLW